MNMNLRELYLADNKLNGLQDSAQLGNLLKFNCSLQILDLRNNHVLDSGVPVCRCAAETALIGSLGLRVGGQARAPGSPWYRRPESPGMEEALTTRLP